MGSINIKACSESDAIDILKQKGVAERIQCEATQIRDGNCFLVNDRMLLVLIEHGKDIEAHIAEPREYWPYIHKDIKQAIIFINDLGYNSIYTNVRNELKKTLNLLAKHGFKRVHKDDKEVILQWVSKQQS